MTNGILGLAELIHEHTGEEGPELMAMTFYVAAGYASIMGKPEIADYFDKRCRESTKKSRFAANQRKFDESLGRNTA